MGMAAVIVAAGRGERAGESGLPKQYRHIGARPVIARTVALFTDHPAIDAVQVVIAEGHEALYRDAVAPHPKLLPPVTGASERQGSVLRGLEALAGRTPGHVLVHDAARPFATADLIARVADRLATADAVVPVLPVTSTLKRVTPDGAAAETVPRDDLAAAETPQGFAFAPILAAYRAAEAAGAHHTDDAAVAAATGMTVATVAGAHGNVKLTTAGDLAEADEMLTLREMARLGDVRVGIGYDVHAFTDGDHVTLGGLRIDHDAGLAGHSDADVVLHALTDAILGALGDGDIGAHFPPSDERWRGEPSATFLAFAADRVRARGGAIGHLDVTLVGEAPKLSPHREAMRARIAEICAISLDRVGAKATTNEGLGFVGRREGLAAWATATIRLPFPTGGGGA